jgi:hypothetical protein
MRLTRLAFRLRFTQAEKVAIEMAALDNPAAPLAQRMAAAALRADLADTAVSLFIDTNRAETRAGVLALASFGLLAPERPTVILDTQAQLHELYDPADFDLPVVPAPEPLPVGSAVIYRIGENFMTVQEGEAPPEAFDASWVVSAVLAKTIAEGAEIRKSGDGVAVVTQVG